MVKLKQIFKLYGVIIITVCAVTVCTMFINRIFDIQKVLRSVTDAETVALLEASVSMSRLVASLAGGVLGITTLIMLLFSIRQYIEENKSSLGVLKALGYGSLRLSLPYLKYSLVVFCSSILGYGLGMMLLKIGILDSIGSSSIEIATSFNLLPFIFLAIAPAVIIGALSFVYVLLKLKIPPLKLINPAASVKSGKFNKASKKADKPFLKELSRSSLLSNMMICFFIAFAAFCFCAEIQLSFSMKNLIEGDASTFIAILVTLGLILGTTTLILAMSFLVSSNKKNISMLKVYGYENREINSALFNKYRFVALIGFAIGSLYQYALQFIMLGLFEKSYEFMPKAQYSFPALLITLAIYALIFEGAMFIFKKRAEKISLKEVMLDA